jgi:hypothetical protein
MSGAAAPGRTGAAARPAALVAGWMVAIVLALATGVAQTPSQLPRALASVAAQGGGDAVGDSGDEAGLPLYPDVAALERGIELLYRTEYAAARQRLERVAARYPEHPAGPLFLSLVDFALLYEGADPGAARETAFLSAIDRALERAEALRDDPGTDALGRFYEGSAHGFRARHRAMQGQWWGAYRDGVRARDRLEEALEARPDWVDANLGLGAYHVAADVLPRFLKAFDWLLRIRGDRARGMRELEEARRRGVLTRIEATFLLATFATEFDRQHDRGLGLARELIAAFPHNAAFRAVEARALMGLGEYTIAGRRLTGSYLDDVWRRPAHRVRQSAFELGRWLVRSGDERGGARLLGHHFERVDDPYTWFLPWVRYYLGRAHELLGDRRSARTWYERAADLADRAGSRDRARDAARHALDDAERAWERCRARARTRARSPEALALAAGLLADPAVADGAGDDELTAGRVRWAAAIAAMRGGEPRAAAGHFALALRAGVPESWQDECLLGRAAALRAAGDSTGAGAVCEAVLARPDLAQAHGRVRRGLDLLAAARASRPAAAAAAAVAATGAVGHAVLDLDLEGIDWLLAPAVAVEPLGMPAARVVLPGSCGRFSGVVRLPAGGLAYRLYVPGGGSRQDPGNPLPAPAGAAIAASWRPGEAERTQAAGWPLLPGASGPSDSAGIDASIE